VAQLEFLVDRCADLSWWTPNYKIAVLFPQTA